MTLLAVERIKLFSTRSPWWCAFLAVGLTVGFAALMASQLESAMTPSMTQTGYQFGLMVVMVMAALAITTEYRFGTIRATFQAAPNRTAVLVSKTAVVAAAALIIGEIAAFGSLGAGALFAENPDLALSSAQAWRQVAGVGLIFLFGAVLAMGIGTLLRHSAGAITLILVWTLLAESMLPMIPKIGDGLREYMPFVVAGEFVQGTQSTMALGGSPFSTWGALAYFAAVSIGVWVLGLVVAHRRDA